MVQHQEATRLQVIVHELKVGDVMNRNLVTVQPDALTADLREILRAKRISGLPVVEGQKLLGIISIEEKTTRNVVTIFDDVSLVHAIHKFETSNLGRFPVLDRETGRLVGILAKRDIVNGLLRKYERNHARQMEPPS